MGTSEYRYVRDMQPGDNIIGVGIVLRVEGDTIYFLDGRKIVDTSPNHPWANVIPAELATPHHGTPGGEHPDHPPVEGGYTGTAQNPGATGTAQNPTGACPDISECNNSGCKGCADGPVIHTPAGERASADAPAPSVLAEAMLADAVRRAPALPTDSAERKRTPLCAGLLDYAPAALTELAGTITRSERLADDLVAALRDRDWASVCVLALCDLDSELEAGGDLEAVMSLTDLFTEFAASLAAVAQVSWYGNEKHNPGQPLHHARGKSTDHADCILRHHVERGGFDGPMRHSACKLWRGLIAWQEDLEAAGAALARGARLPAETGGAK